MRITERAYRSTGDLLSIGALIRRAYARLPYWNAWSFARFDIWAQRRIADERGVGLRAWQQDICFWEDARGALAGAAFFPYARIEGSRRDPHAAALIGDFDQRGLIERMLSWVEAYHAQKGFADGALHIEVMERNMLLGQLLESRGYVKPSSYFIYRVRPLGGGLEPVVLPAGFTLKRLETLAELRQHFAAVKTVFDFQDTVEAYRSIQRAPSYRPDLDLIVVSGQGEIAAFCTVWVDTANGIAEFEPVGTLPGYQKRGLGAALLAEACNRLRSLGCGSVTVNSWSESIGANKLYSAAGLAGQDQIYDWQREQI
jgi:mycothiol synthase